MARVTVEDCLEHIDNRFELVLTAAKRSRQLANGRDSQLEWENDKPTVMALREIAEGIVTPESVDAPLHEPEEMAAEQPEGGPEAAADPAGGETDQA